MVKLTDLPLDGVARFEQRPDRSHQLRAILDQLLGAYRKDIERGTSDHETDVLEKAAHLVLEIALDLDQQRPTCQQSPDRVAVEILDVGISLDDINIVTGAGRIRTGTINLAVLNMLPS